MLNADVLTFREYVMQETLPLSTIHEAVLNFLRGRNDVVLFGAQAVNAYVNESRMTQDVDLIALRAEKLAKELRDHLHNKFNIAVRIRSVASGKGFRLFQIRKEGNRHLVDIKSVDTLPNSQQIADISVMALVELIASKIISYHSRQGKPKAGTDWRDIAVLLLAHPELKTESGEVMQCLLSMEAAAPILDLWHQIVAQEITAEQDEDEFM